MPRRQLTKNDTSVFTEKYLDGSAGIVNESSGADAPIDSACTGSLDGTALAATNASFVPGQAIYIEQTQGTNADADPNGEYNVIQAYTAGTITTKYKLTRDYTTGAQVIVMKPTLDWNLNGATLTPKPWNGSVGGILIRVANHKIYGTGTIDLRECGFRGGAARAANGGGNSGEGYPGASQNSTSANGNGGGGGQNSNGAGAGAGNANAGGVPNSGGVSGGLAAGNASLTIFPMGAGSGSGSNQSGAGFSGQGRTGAGKFIFIAPEIDISAMTINVNGKDGLTSTGSDGSPGPSGGSSAGSGLFKTMKLALGSNQAVALGGNGVSGGGNTSGSGSVGRFHADIVSATQLTGTTNPTIDVSEDFMVSQSGGAMAFFE